MTTRTIQEQNRPGFMKREWRINSPLAKIFIILATGLFGLWLLLVLLGAIIYFLS